MRELIERAVFHEMLFDRLMERPWVRDGIDEDENTVVDELGRIAEKGEGEALRILDMPFLETVDPADPLATMALRRMAYLNAEGDEDPISTHFLQVIDHLNIRDGITDNEAKVVVTLYSARKNAPYLVDTLLDPTKVTLEERTINLPLAGDVNLAIVRIAPGAKRSMDLLEFVVRKSEELMGEPFPIRYVAWHFGDAVNPSSAGTNYGTHITTLARYDVDDGSNNAEFTRRHIAHEVAHYYWTGHVDWIDEGGANFLSHLLMSSDARRPLIPEEVPCGYASNISDLESLNPKQGSPEFLCNYSLGERLFHDLHRSLNSATFSSGFRRLYLLSKFDSPDDECEGTALNICHLREAFTSNVPEDAAASAEKVLSRWYEGTEPYEQIPYDSVSVDPRIDLFDGSVDQVYIALDEDRRKETKTDSFSASDIEGKVNLMLELQHPMLDQDVTLSFTLATYFVDGFAFGGRTRIGTVMAGWRNSYRWFSIGPVAGGKWAIGQYHVNVYHEEQKIAEVEFRVTP